MTGNVISIEDRIPKLKEQRKKKANRRVILILLLFFLIVMIVVYFQTPLSRVGKISVAGNEYTDSDFIIGKTGLTADTSIMNIEIKEISKRIEALPEIKKASAEIKFPNKVFISVEEYKRVGIIYKDSTFFPLLENGEVIPSATGTNSRLLGPVLKNYDNEKMIALTAEQLNNLNDEVKHAISEIIYSPKETDQYSIVAYMNDGNEVRATLRSFADKMEYYPDIIGQIEPNVKGIIDLEVGLFFKSYASEIQELQIESDEDSEG